MSRLLAGGFLAVLLAEIVGLLLGWHWALPIGGVAVAVFALQLTGRLARGARDGADGSEPSEALESLMRWKAQTEELIHWADGSRGEWDRYLRPKLARDFLIATKQKDPAAVASAGHLVFGAELWQWVDPQNVSAARRGEPGPGRDALDEILRRLEQA
ncbi:MAG: hypothetical protein FGM52_09250 [Mycobacterium sp.]|nr:hypothetical protein [Mycobacterium sp.]